MNNFGGRNYIYPFILCKEETNSLKAEPERNISKKVNSYTNTEQSSTCEGKDVWRELYRITVRCIMYFCWPHPLTHTFKVVGSRGLDPI